MDLTFARDPRGASWRGYAANGLELFSISPTAVRGSEAVNLRGQLPGLDGDRAFEADGCSRWDSKTRKLAMEYAAGRLEEWAMDVFGVDLSVNIIDNT